MSGIGQYTDYINVENHRQCDLCSGVKRDGFVFIENQTDEKVRHYVHQCCLQKLPKKERFEKFGEIGKIIPFKTFSSEGWLDLVQKIDSLACLYFLLENGQPISEEMRWQAAQRIAQRKEENTIILLKGLLAQNPSKKDEDGMWGRRLSDLAYANRVQAYVVDPDKKLSVEDRGLIVKRAAERGHEKIVKVFLRSGRILEADQGRALLLASLMGHTQIVKDLVAHETVSLRDLLDAHAWAKANGHEEIASLLAPKPLYVEQVQACGVDPDKKLTVEDRRPIVQHAAKREREEIIRDCLHSERVLKDGSGPHTDSPQSHEADAKGKRSFSAWECQIARFLGHPGLGQGHCP